MSLFKKKNTAELTEDKKTKEKTNLAGFIVDHNKVIQKIFLVVTVICLMLIPFVSVNYDMTNYLPDYAPSKAAINKMEESFGYPGTGRIMLKDVTLYEAAQYKQQLEKVDGVDMIIWCDLTTNVYGSSEFVDYTDIDEYYKDNCAVMNVTFVEGDSSNRTKRAINAMEEITGDKGYFVGTAPTNKFTQEQVEKQMQLILSIGVAMIFLILLVTTTSWFEPVLFLTVIGCAVIINNGTNVFVGDISFVTNNVTSVLQIAVSMDYSVFLLDAFEREIENGKDKITALKLALDAALKTILASSLTTLVGFIVLVTMNFKIGFDMGIVFSKGIICSLLAIILFMPSLILRWSDRIDRTRHRAFLPRFNRFSKVVYKLSPIVMIAVLVLIVPCYVGQDMNKFEYGTEAIGAGPGTKIYEQQQEINERFGRSNLFVLLFPDTSRAKEKELSEEIENLDAVTKVMSMGNYLPDGVPDSILPKNITELFYKDGYTRMMVYAKTKGESTLSYQVSDEITKLLRKYYPEDSYITGDTPCTMDMESMLSEDYARVNVLSIVGILLVVAFSFKSAILPILTMIPIETAIIVNMFVPYVTGDSIIFIGYVVVSCIQMGATVDYAILSTDNYLNCRKTMDKKEAAHEMIRLTFPSILTSASILIIVGYIISFISSVPAIAELGHLIGRGAICSLCLVTLLMPVLLTTFDKFVSTDYQTRRGQRRALVISAVTAAKNRRRRIRERLLDRVKGERS